MREPVTRAARSLAPALLVALLGGALFGRGLGNATEYEVKAAFLFNFAKYTTWPEESFKSAETPFVVGVLGTDPFGGVLDATLKDKKIGSHPVVVERYETLQNVRTPHLLFVGGTDRENAEKIAKALGERPILIVGDCPGLAAAGFTAGFYLEKNTIHFEMNPLAAKRARLVIAVQLLKLARIVSR